MAVMFSLIFGHGLMGKRIINFLRRKQLAETVKGFGSGWPETEKLVLPPWWDLIIIMSTLIPVLLFARFLRQYFIILLSLLRSGWEYNWLCRRLIKISKE